MKKCLLWNTLCRRLKLFFFVSYAPGKYVRFLYMSIIGQPTKESTCQNNYSILVISGSGWPFILVFIFCFWQFFNFCAGPHSGVHCEMLREMPCPTVISFCWPLGIIFPELSIEKKFMKLTPIKFCHFVLKTLWNSCCRITFVILFDDYWYQHPNFVVNKAKLNSH